MKQTLYTTCIVIILLITNFFLTYSQSTAKWMSSEEINKSNDFYVRLEWDCAFSKTKLNNSISYKLALGFGQNEFGFSRVNFYGEQDRLVTYSRTEITWILFIPIPTTLDSRSVDAYEFNMFCASYSRIVNIADWLDICFSGGIGYGSGFERKATNKKKVKYNSGGSFSGRSSSVYTCDVIEEKIESLVVPVSASLEFKANDWFELSLGVNYYFSNEIKNPKFRLGTSIFLFKD